MLNLLFGHITNIDSNGRAAVLLPELDNWVTDFMPLIKSKSKNDKENDPLCIDEEVAVLFDDEKQHGVILGAINTDSSPLVISDRNKVYRTFKDATHIEYDKAAHVVKADIKGEVNITAQKTTHTGDLYVTGNIFCSKDITDKNGSMQSMRDTYNSHGHGGQGASPPAAQMSNNTVAKV